MYWGMRSSWCAVSSPTTQHHPRFRQRATTDRAGGRRAARDRVDGPPIVIVERTLEKGFDKASTRAAKVAGRSFDTTSDRLAGEQSDASKSSSAPSA